MRSQADQSLDTVRSIINDCAKELGTMGYALSYAIGQVLERTILRAYTLGYHAGARDENSKITATIRYREATPEVDLLTQVRNLDNPVDVATVIATGADLLGAMLERQQERIGDLECRLRQLEERRGSI